MTNGQCLAIIAAIIRESNEGYSIEEAVRSAQDYLAIAKAIIREAQNG